MMIKWDELVFWAGVLALLIFVSLHPAFAGVEVSVGAQEFGKRGDGNWYQKEYGAYSLNTRSPTLALGWADEYRGVRWRAGVQYLGRHSTSCDCLSSDRAYALYKEGVDIGWPQSKYSTKGDAYGVYLTALPEWRLSADWAVFAEVGVGYFGVSNEVRVLHWYPATNAEHTEWGNPQTLEVSNGRRWRLTPIIGAGLRRDGTSLAVNIREVSRRGNWYSIADKYGVSVELRQEF